jgi:hypothetical protein
MGKGVGGEEGEGGRAGEYFDLFLPSACILRPHCLSAGPGSVFIH